MADWSEPCDGGSDQRVIVQLSPATGLALAIRTIRAALATFFFVFFAALLFFLCHANVPHLTLVMRYLHLAVITLRANPSQYPAR